MIATDLPTTILACLMGVGIFVFMFWAASHQMTREQYEASMPNTKVVTLGMLSSKAKTKRVIEAQARRGYHLQSMSDNRGGFAGRPIATLVFTKKK